MTTQRPSTLEDPNDTDQGITRSMPANTTSIDRGLISAMVGHELREPLNAIISFLNIAIQERIGPLNELQSEFLRSTESAARRLERRINDVQVALLDGDALELRRRWINPNARVIATCRELEWAADRFEVAIHTELEQSSRNPDAWADPDRLDQILINLIENAIRYAEAGSEVLVKTSFGEQGHWRLLVENEVEDGQRYHPESWFEPGERSHRASDPHRPGLGLGLTIAKYLVDSHGGEIWATVEGNRVQVGFSIPHRTRLTSSAHSLDGSRQVSIR